MKTFTLSRGYTLTPESISVQAHIGRLEELEQYH